jgi:pimeloyl-ACP methyl ester carboxylesterase
MRENKIFYRSKDGTKLCGINALPKNIKEHALLVHGITMDKNEWNNFYVDIASELYKRYIASLRFDLRAHGESKGSQRELTIIGALLDVKASVDRIMDQKNGKVSIIATSFGAGPSILYAALNKDKVKKLILLCPVIDYVTTFLEPLVPWARESFNEEGFKHLEKKGYLLLDDAFEIGAKLVEELRVIKPYELLKEIECPMLTIHGNKDAMVPYDISKRYCAGNNNFEFITIKDADHGFIAYDDETGDSEKSKENIKRVIDKIGDWLEEKSYNDT